MEDLNKAVDMRELSDLDLGSREGRQVSTEKRKRDSAANPDRGISIVSVDNKKKKRVEIDNSESFDFADIVLDLEIQDRFMEDPSILRTSSPTNLHYAAHSVACTHQVNGCALMFSDARILDEHAAKCEFMPQKFRTCYICNPARSFYYERDYNDHLEKRRHVDMLVGPYTVPQQNLEIVGQEPQQQGDKRLKTNDDGDEEDKEEETLDKTTIKLMESQLKELNLEKQTWVAKNSNLAKINQSLKENLGGQSKNISRLEKDLQRTKADKQKGEDGNIKLLEILEKRDTRLNTNKKEMAKLEEERSNAKNKLDKKCTEINKVEKALKEAQEEKTQLKAEMNADNKKSNDMLVESEKRMKSLEAEGVADKESLDALADKLAKAENRVKSLEAQGAADKASLDALAGKLAKAVKRVKMRMESLEAQGAADKASLEALVESNGSKDCELIKILREQQDYLENYRQDWQKKISALTSQHGEEAKEGQEHLQH